MSSAPPSSKSLRASPASAESTISARAAPAIRISRNSTWRWTGTSPLQRRTTSSKTSKSDVFPRVEVLIHLDPEGHVDTDNPLVEADVTPHWFSKRI